MTPVNVRVFINYRHDDTEGEALLLYERLSSRFVADNAFLETELASSTNPTTPRSAMRTSARISVSS